MLIGGGLGRSPVEVSHARSTATAAGEVGTTDLPALALGRTKTFRGTSRLGLVDRSDRARVGGYFGVATSVPDTGRGIFLGCGGLIIAIHRPGKSWKLAKKG